MYEYKFVGKALLFPMERILVISDLHMGYEEAMNSAGVFLPRQQFKQTKQDLEKVFHEVGRMKEVVILGDLKHEFGTISGQEWREVLEIVDYLGENSDKLILIRGNHDTILEPIAKRKELEIRDFYILGEIAFLHGDKQYLEALAREIKMIVMGHKHPAITLREGSKAETYKCFLVGKWKGKKIVILPSFFPLVEGSDVSIHDTNLGFNFDLGKFEAFVVGDKVYDFGKVEKIGRLS